jgi:hypothetical protein
MSKIQKKQYLLCPQCHKYTRQKKITVPNDTFNFFKFSPVLMETAKSIMNRSADTTAEKCKHCGATDNLQKVFLDTEVEKKKEIAFTTPAGERIEVIQ